MGVAVLGSLLSTIYRNGIDGQLGVLPAFDRHAAGESVQATLAVAEKLGPAGRALVRSANDAFIHAMHITAIGSAAVVLVFLPGNDAAAATDGDKSKRQTVGANGDHEPSPRDTGGDPCWGRPRRPRRHPTGASEACADFGAADLLRRAIAEPPTALETPAKSPSGSAVTSPRPTPF